jgi:hypothetical protein
MDVDKTLRRLQQAADSTLFRDVVFTPEMEAKVRAKVNKRNWSNVPRIFSLAAAVVLIAVLLWKIVPLDEADKWTATRPEPRQSMLPDTVWDPPVLWKPSPRTEMYQQNPPFSYYGEKPVRIITEELYEDQAQKVMWLLNGSFADEVELVGISAAGERVELGEWKVGGPLYDADGHFPSSIALPSPGVWKLQVLSGGKHFGHVFVEVKAGVHPANRSLVEPLIERYIQTNRAAFGWLGEDLEITLDLLGVESPDAETKRAYAWVKLMSKGKPWSSSGISTPMAFHIAYVGRDYRVVSHRMPEDGSRYWSSIQEIFPPKYVEMIQKRSGKTD